MGFATFAANLRTAMLSDALGWAQDFTPIIAAVVGLLTFGVAVQIIRRFV